MKYIAYLCGGMKKLEGGTPIGYLKTKRKCFGIEEKVTRWCFEKIKKKKKVEEEVTMRCLKNRVVFLKKKNT